MTGCKLVAATSVHKQTVHGMYDLDCEAHPIVDLAIGKPSVQPAQRQPTATVAELPTAPRNLAAPCTVQASPPSTPQLTMPPATCSSQRRLTHCVWMTQDVRNHLQMDTGIFNVTVVAPVTVHHQQSNNKADLIIGDTRNHLKVSAASTSHPCAQSPTTSPSQLTPHCLADGRLERQRPLAPHPRPAAARPPGPPTTSHTRLQRLPGSCLIAHFTPGDTCLRRNSSSRPLPPPWTVESTTT